MRTGWRGPRALLAGAAMGALASAAACFGDDVNGPVPPPLDAAPPVGDAERPGDALADAISNDAALADAAAPDAPAADAAAPREDAGDADAALDAPDATELDAAHADADAGAQDARVCAPRAAVSCADDAGEAGIAVACNGAGDGYETTTCAEGCHPDAGRCIAPLTVNAGPDPVLSPDSSVTLTAVASGGVEPYAFAWSPEAALSDASAQAPIASPTATTPYTVTVTDTRQRTASDTVLVKVPDAPMNLARWTVVQYDVASQGSASWTFQQNGTIAVQGTNADPSILYGDFDLVDAEVTGRFTITQGGDDDLVGFVFGYQDPGRYYLFDWKGGTQTYCGATAGVGMSVKRVAVAGTPTCADLWSSTGTTDDGGAPRVAVLSPASAHARPWALNTAYDFRLAHARGRIVVEVKQGTAWSETLTVDDATYPSGRFGFYNFSQGGVRYELFKARDLP